MLDTMQIPPLTLTVSLQSKVCVVIVFQGWGQDLNTGPSQSQFPFCWFLMFPEACLIFKN